MDISGIFFVICCNGKMTNLLVMGTGESRARGYPKSTPKIKAIKIHSQRATDRALDFGRVWVFEAECIRMDVWKKKVSHFCCRKSP